MTTFAAAGPRSIENDHLRVTVLSGGGHIAEVHDKATGINPLWTPPWPSIEPSQFDADRHRDYGDGVDARAAGRHHGPQPLPRHLRRAVGRRGARRPAGARRGVVGRLRRRRAAATPSMLRARLPLAGLRARAAARAPRPRRLDPRNGAQPGRRRPAESAGPARHPRSAVSREGPDRVPRVGRTRSRVFESAFGAADYLAAGADFDWPHAPLIGGGTGRSPPVFTDAGRLERLYGSLDGSSAADMAFFVAFAVRRAAGVRLRLAPRGFPVAGHLGGEPEPSATRPGTRER